MPELNFQKRFAAAVESGEKCQTIRAYRKDGRDPKVGDTLYLFTGMRTKQCRRLGEAVCTSVHRFQLTRSRRMCIYDDFDEDETTASIAEKDGFGCEAEMLDWFDKTHGLPFEGLLIRWEKS